MLLAPVERRRDRVALEGHLPREVAAQSVLGLIATVVSSLVLFVGGGALLSELHPNTPPKGQNLMARDRIISGLSRAVIVIEAGEKSGSLVVSG